MRFEYDFQEKELAIKSNDLISPHPKSNYVRKNCAAMQTRY